MGSCPSSFSDRSRYLLTFTNDYSWYIGVFFLQHKSEVFSCLKSSTLLHRLNFLRISRIFGLIGEANLSPPFFLLSAFSLASTGNLQQPTHNIKTIFLKRNIGHSWMQLKVLPSKPFFPPFYLWEELTQSANYLLNRCTTGPFQNLLLLLISTSGSLI